MTWDRHIGRRLKLRDLYILMTVVQARGMGRAADLLHMSQPAVSNAIADLERAIGVRLLDRSRQGVEPTSYGEALIKRGASVFDELRQGIEDIEFLADPTAGELRIGSSESMASGPVVTVVDQLSERYPRIVFKVVTGDTGKLLRELSERNIELIISRMAEPVAEEQMAVEFLFHDRWVVAAGMQNPWTRRRKIELSELVNERWTLLPFDTFPGILTVEAFRASGLEPPRATVITQSSNMRNRLLATGRFLTTLPSFSFTLAGRDHSLKALPVQLPNTQRPIGIVSLKNRTLSPLAQLFIDRMRTVVKPLTKAKESIS